MLIADREKALVDYLYFTGRKKEKFNERTDISSLSKRKMCRYAKLFNDKKLDEWVKTLFKQERIK